MKRLIAVAILLTVTATAWSAKHSPGVYRVTVREEVTLTPVELPIKVGDDSASMFLFELSIDTVEVWEPLWWIGDTSNVIDSVMLEW